MTSIEFERERNVINNRLGPKLHKIHRLANVGNSLAQKIIHIYERWMDSKDDGDLRQLQEVLTQFEQVERNNKL